jgi:hypothetical protein
MGSGAMIYVLSLIKIGSGILKLLEGGGIHTKTGKWSYKTTFNF